MNELIYPALIRKTDNGYQLTIPQFDIQAAGEEQIEVIRNASEALSRRLPSMKTQEYAFRFRRTSAKRREVLLPLY